MTDSLSASSKMPIPCLSKVTYRNNVLVERALPSKGLLNVSVGQVVKPFTELGKTTDFILLSGLWGTVEDVVPQHSVLLKTSLVDLHLVAGTLPYAEGELITFPRPGDVVQQQYLQKFGYSLSGKLVYVGDTVSLEALSMARTFGVAGILAGGCSKQVYDFAVQSGMFLGLFSGFGLTKTSCDVYETLAGVSTRIAFASAEDHVLRIPVPLGFAPERLASHAFSVFKPLEIGLRVYVLQPPYLGDTGRVTQVLDALNGRVAVQLDSNGSTVDLSVPNFLALL